MKIHTNVTNKIVRFRSSMVDLKRLARDVANVAVLDAIIEQTDSMLKIADDFLAGPAAAPRKQDAFSMCSMQPGDWFDVEADRVKVLRVCASQYGKRHGMRFTVRLKSDGGARCVRVDGLHEHPQCLADLLADSDTF